LAITGSSETLVTTYEITRYHNPANHDRNFHPLKSVMHNIFGTIRISRIYIGLHCSSRPDLASVNVHSSSCDVQRHLGLHKYAKLRPTVVHSFRLVRSLRRPKLVSPSILVQNIWGSGYLFRFFVVSHYVCLRKHNFMTSVLYLFYLPEPEGRYVVARRVSTHSQVQVSFSSPCTSHVEDDTLWIRDGHSTYGHQEQQQWGGAPQRREYWQQNLCKQNNSCLPVTRFRWWFLCNFWGSR
jgi:hypothetical protein